MEIYINEKVGKLGVDELYLYVHLCLNASRDGIIDGSKKELSNMVGLSVSRMNKALDSLFEIGLLSFGSGKVKLIGFNTVVKFNGNEKPSLPLVEKEKSLVLDKPNDDGLSDKAHKMCEYFNKQVRDGGIPKIHLMTPKRKSMVTARLKEYGEESVRLMIDKAAVSSFLNGKSERGWMASFDWIMRPNNFAKVLEGNYDDRKQGNHGDEQSYYQGTAELMQRLNREREAKNSQ